MPSSLRLALLLILALCLGERPARACGAFASGQWLKAPPRLSLERTLIVWDSSTKLQHFVRELRFAHAAGEFGFVVPTPSRPRVHAVEKSPFDELEKRYPSGLVESSLLLGGLGFGAGLGGSGRGTAPRTPPVQVIEKKRVGDFTAFVLTATDKDALSAWLDKHGFKSGEAGKAWMAGYVQLGFHFVALRYDGTQAANEELTSRTLRISFQSELPFYPYREPSDAPEQKNRELELWVVSDVPLIPYAGVTLHDEWRLRRPFSEGARSFPFVGEVEAPLGKELSGLLPRTRVVQTFGDFKQQRRGWEDVVFVPMAKCDDACRSARARLLPLVDARLGAQANPAGPSPSTSATGTPPRASAANALSCGVGRHGDESWWLIVLGALCLRRRRGAHPWRSALPILGLLLFACDRATPSPAPRASAAVTASAPAPSASGALNTLPEMFVAPRDVAARTRAVLDVFAHRFDGYVPVWSLPIEGGMGSVRSEPEEPWPGALAAANTCAPGLEAAVTLEVDLDDKGFIKQTRATGPVPGKVRECIEAQVSNTVFSPEGGQRTERAQAYFGDKSPEAQRIAREISATRRRFVPALGARLRISDLKVSDGLPFEVVQRVLRQHYTQYRACHVQHGAPAASDELVTIKLVVDATGKAVSVRVVAKRAPALGSCIARSIRPARFPKPTRAPVQISATMTFGSP